MDRGAWRAAVHGVARSQRRLSDFAFTFHFHALEKELAAHYSVLAWRIPGTGEPGGLSSMGSHRVRHDWSDSAVAARYGSGHAGYAQKHCHSKEVLKFLSESLPSASTSFSSALCLTAPNVQTTQETCLQNMPAHFFLPFLHLEPSDLHPHGNPHLSFQVSLKMYSLLPLSISDLSKVEEKF